MPGASMTVPGRWAGWFVLLSMSTLAPADDGPAQTGPATEQRFPTLVVPPGFRATLFACDPLVEYPSAVASGPRPGSILVAVDYVTGLGVEIVRRDEIRLVEDTNGDGYADRATVFAAGFNSIQGLTYHGGTVYVAHAPLLSALKDRDGDGVADERRDLLSGLGLPPEENPSRLHCANGVAAGHDGWLYLALGDHGCDVPRPEGDRLVLRGGGILRCRADGRDLHVFSTGLRNIYDVALDADLNVFVRDNENDGGSYMIRVAHSIFGGDHGYPYLYDERPAEALAPLADLGRGSSAGGLCYLETAFPPEYRGDLFFCEWGRAVVRYRPARTSDTAAFAPIAEVEFASGARHDPYGFKPTDLALQADGSLIVADWGDGQRPKRGRGRIYRITADGVVNPPAPVPDFQRLDLDACIARLDAASHAERCAAQEAITRRGPDGAAALRLALRAGRPGVLGRLHAVWVVTHVEGPSAVPFLLDLAGTDPEPRVRAQAVRAVADLADPVLATHRLEPGPGDLGLATRLAALAGGQDPRVVLEVVIALGRLRWKDAPRWLRTSLPDPDPVLAHAAMQTLRRSNQWGAILDLLDEPDSASGPWRGIALRAIADRYEPEVADRLIARLKVETNARRRGEYADLLTRIASKPGPAAYWGYRPPPRPANSVRWDRTDAIEQALDSALADSSTERSVRLALLRRLQREQIAVRSETLVPWLRLERDPDAVAVLLASLRGPLDRAARVALETILEDRAHSASNRQAAFATWAADEDNAREGRLLELAGSLEDGPVLAAVLRQIRTLPKAKAAVTPVLVARLSSSDSGVRAAAVDALAALGAVDAGEPVRQLLVDPDATVRRAAAAAMGPLRVRSATRALLDLARESDPALRGASLDALRQLREPMAVPLAVAALSDRGTQGTALRCIEDLGGPDQLGDVVALAARNPDAEVVHQVVRLVLGWSQRAGVSPDQARELDRAAARVQGVSGILSRWRVAGPLAGAGAGTEAALAADVARIAAPGSPLEPSEENPLGWPSHSATGADARLRLQTATPGGSDHSWLACADLELPEPAAVEFLASGSGRLQIWLNGRSVFIRAEARPFVPDSDRFEGTLARGPNRVVVALTTSAALAEFHLRFRRKGSTAERERLMQLALTRPGNPARGRALFLDSEKSQCLKCHRLRDQGGAIGPDLTRAGGRYPRAYLIESILEPSRTIAPSYDTLVLALNDGRVLTGVRTAETAAELTLADRDGRVHVLALADIEARRQDVASLMPDGLEKQLTPDEFVDLVAFLASEK